MVVKSDVRSEGVRAQNLKIGRPLSFLNGNCMKCNGNANSLHFYRISKILYCNFSICDPVFI